nr:SIS domain-containing protein [Solimonas marina]
MSRMLEEALSAGDAVAAQAAPSAATLAALGARLRTLAPKVALTVARGSSDHAANYLGYLLMSRLGVPVASLPMSLVTLGQTPLQVRDQLVLALSQSGRSPDLVETTRALTAAGALSVAMVNAEGSPLAEAATVSLPLGAGPELSVAATKSYIATLAMGARLVAHWQQDAALLDALASLPAALHAASQLDWTPAVTALRDASRMMVIGRGRTLSIALEAALKFKETCALQAEAFSGAEVRHGPMALVDDRYPMLVFAPRGPEQAGLLEVAREMRGRGARVLLAAPDDVVDRDLPLTSSAHVDLDPLLAIQSFYVMAAQLSQARGLDADAPRHLNKVTSTR